MSKLGKARQYKKQLIAYGMKRPDARALTKQYRKGEVSDEVMQDQLSSWQSVHEHVDPRKIAEKKIKF